MGLFGSIGKALGGIGKIASKLPIPGGGLIGGGLGALGGLLQGGGLGGALKGGLGGLLGGAAAQSGGANPLLAGGLGGLGALLLGERGKDREAAEAASNARNDLLRRNLGLAEKQFASKQGLRDVGSGAIGAFFKSGGGRGIFQTPREAGSLEPVTDKFAFGLDKDFSAGIPLGPAGPGATPPAPSDVKSPPAKPKGKKAAPRRSGGGGGSRGDEKDERGGRTELV